MPREHRYFVYILASRSRTLYIGVTNDLLNRIRQHRAGAADTFTARYGIHRLAYYEVFDDIRLAIPREKYLKHLTRSEKIALIETTNPIWHDLSEQYLPAHKKADPRPAAKDDNLPIESVEEASASKLIRPNT